MTTRRKFLTGMAKSSLLATSIQSLRSSPAGAGTSTAAQNLIWITCFGGWDATRALIPAFDNPLVNMETLAEPMHFGDLHLVDHPDRMSVRQFFERYSLYSTVIHGILTPSVAHEACLQLIRTGALSGQADWPTRIASACFAQSPIPHLVLSGQSFAGDLGHLIAKTGSGAKIKSLLAGTNSENSDLFVTASTSRIRAAEVQMRQRRVQQLIEQSNQDPIALQMLEQFHVNASSAQTLKDRQNLIDWNRDGSFLGDCLTAVDILREGISHCISIEHPALWDSHSSNDVFQHWLWDELFFSLGELCQELERTETETGTLLDQTTIVVASDMGRAPSLNSSQGKDHWPYSSALILSAQIEGQRSIGGYDRGFQGASLQSMFGNAFTEERLTAKHFGESLLQLWDIDVDTDLRSIFST